MYRYVNDVVRYLDENKLPSPNERKEFNNTIKEAERMVIHEGNYQIGIMGSHAIP